MKGSLIILAFFSAGVLLGAFNLLPDIIEQNDYSQYALYLLMFLVGVGIGSDPRSLRAILNFNLRFLAIPLITIIGTYLGVTLVFVFLQGFTLSEVLAVGSGFGYYSLSSIIITELRSEPLGVVALLSNVLREISTLLLAPLFAAYFGKISPICAAGATSMDTTLPIITVVSGKDMAMISILHGILLTLLVPFLVAIMLSL